MLQPAPMSRVLFALLCLAAPAEALAQGLSARFSNQVATLGAPLTVVVEVDDPNRVVHRVQVELRRPDAVTWTATAAHPRPDDPQRWEARLEAEALWPRDAPAPETLELRALLYGRRGGLLMVLGELDPFVMDVMTPARAAARRRALRGPGRAEAARTGADDFTLAGYVGAEGRLGSSARARGFIGAGGPVGRALELRGVVTVGPNFAEPGDRAGGGAVTLGFELGLRAYVQPLADEAWNLFAAPFAAAEVRLPGFDAGGGLRAGVLYWVSTEVAVEAALGGAVMVFGAVAPDGEQTDVGFSGGVRVGVRFGPERR